MNGDYRDYIFAARIIRKANAFLGNGEKCSWTADDFFDLASSVAAETDTPGVCPMCNADVRATSSARVGKHFSQGKICTVSGQWFHVAMPEVRA